MTSDIYTDVVLEHYKNPRNRGKLKEPDLRIRGTNRACGDIITIYLKLADDETIGEVRFDGEGCAVSQASASLFTELIKGRTVAEVERISEKQMLALLGIGSNSMRTECALFPLHVTQKHLFHR